MSKVYGYCRISRATQNIERQERNIRAAFSDAVIIKEAYTGTKVAGRKQFEKLLKTVKAGDTIVFDSVSRMSRDAASGTELYEQLHKAGVKLVFLKEPHINTDVYDKALADADANAIPMTGTTVDIILSAVNEYLRQLRKDQIRIAFDQAQKEVDDLQQRTKEGIETARKNGKQIGQAAGSRLHTKREPQILADIRRYSRDFDGTLKDNEVMKLAGVARGTFYKYKRILAEQLAAE